MIYVFGWWLIAEILGLAALPVAFRCLRWLPDRGYTSSKALGLLIASYLLWLGAMTGFLHNNSGGILFAILAVFGISAYLILKGPHYREFWDFLRQNKRMIAVVEILFLSAFIAWAIVRAYAPDKIMSAGGEKFMEMAFLNGVLNSQRFPPMDVWLSGFAISYYYFGYVMMGLLTRFSGAPAGVGFELYDALLFALTISGVFGIVFNLVAVGSKAPFSKPQPQRPKKSVAAIPKAESQRLQASSYSVDWPILYGLLGSLMVVVMGNLEGLFESLYSRGILPDRFWRWLDIPGLLGSQVTGSWAPGGGFFGCCWRASRVLQDYDLAGQPIGISPITEFPMFSFLLGDNHPHVLALPFVLLCIGLAFNLLLRQIHMINPAVDDQSFSFWHGFWPQIREQLVENWALLLFYAFCLGALGFLNTWDMPIYLGLVALAYGAGEYARRRVLDWQLVLKTILLAVSLLIGAVVIYLLFYFGFSSQAGGILPYVFKSTRLPQYLVMFGPFIFIIAWYLVTLTALKSRQDGKRVVLRSTLAAWGWVLVACLAVTALFLFAILLAANADQLQNPIVQNMLGGGSLSQAMQRFLSDRFANPWLFLLLTGLLALSVANIAQADPGAPGEAEIVPPDASGLFSLLLILVGIALTLSVEFFYLRDSFGVRMNTIFKFYYQAWILLGCASAYAVWWLLHRSQAVLGTFYRSLFLVGAVSLVSAGLIYSLIGTTTRVDGLRGEPNLDGESSLASNNPDDWAGIAWLRENAVGTPVVLEAPGKSYTYEGRISAFSGYPAVLGWAIHESQWRGNYDEQGKREPDIQTIYSTKSGNLALELLHKWNVKYVIVGQSEMNYIQQLCAEPSLACNLTRALQKFETTLTPVFQQGNLTIYQVPEPVE